MNRLEYEKKKTKNKKIWKNNGKHVTRKNCSTKKEQHEKGTAWKWNMDK